MLENPWQQNSFPKDSPHLHIWELIKHISVWLLSFEFSSVITKLLPKVLSVLVLPQ